MLRKSRSDTIIFHKNVSIETHSFREKEFEGFFVFDVVKCGKNKIYVSRVIGLFPALLPHKDEGARHEREYSIQTQP
jgi:hypothetical protein